jgi:hypothetical protein
MALQVQRLNWLGEAHLLADRDADAMRTADAALALTREQGARGDEAWNERLLGEVFSRPAHLDSVAAETHYRSARALADELRMRPLVPHCHLGLGELFLKVGRTELPDSRLAPAMVAANVMVSQ